MPYNTAKGRYADTLDVTLAASAARTADGNGSSVELGDRGTMRLLLNCTAKSGTAPSLLVVIETSFDGTTWREIAAFTALNDATGSQRISAPGCDRFVRARWDLSGTNPSFTFSLTGEAV
jgi:hypothetical protein